MGDFKLTQSDDLADNHKAEYELYDNKSGEHIGSVVIRENQDGHDYVDVYNGDRTSKYEHDHAWSAIGRDTNDIEPGYHPVRQKK